MKLLAYNPQPGVPPLLLLSHPVFLGMGGACGLPQGEHWRGSIRMVGGSSTQTGQGDGFPLKNFLEFIFSVSGVTRELWETRSPPWCITTTPPASEASAQRAPIRRRHRSSKRSLPKSVHLLICRGSLYTRLSYIIDFRKNMR